MPAPAVLSLLVAASLLAGVDAEGFLGGARSRRHGLGILRAGSEELQAALGAVRGCGAEALGRSVPRQQQLFGLGVGESAREALLPIWNAVPKNEYGRVEWKLLRYMMHRHFMHRYKVLVKGFEPTLQLNASHAGTAKILSEHAPALARQLLDGLHAEHGFSLEDTIVMAEALEQLIFSSDLTLLQEVYLDLGLPLGQALGKAEVARLLEAFTVHWLLDADEDGARALLANVTLLEENIPHWRHIASMLAGSVQAAEANRQRAPRAGDGHLALEGRYSFEDVLELVGGIGKSFASYWETECQVIKASLTDMDSTSTGRVRISDFYGANLGGEWRFGESEGYLRMLGALDESSPWRGTQVIIPNYLQAASNCIVSRPHYMVCCANECEDVLSELEVAVGAPLATPEAILEVVGNMTDFNDRPAPLDEALRGQLRRVAETHGGKVPLHGRLFAQWLHFVFPRECAFPHRAGEASFLTPSQFGDTYMVTWDEVTKHVEDGKVFAAGTAAEKGDGLSAIDMQWMTQWSEEEELPGDYSLQLQSPWARRSRLLVPGAAAAAAGAVVTLLWVGLSKDSSFSKGSAASPWQLGGGGAPRVHSV